MHLGSADAAPGMMALVDGIRNEMVPDGPTAVLDVMSGASICYTAYAHNHKLTLLFHRRLSHRL